MVIFDEREAAYYCQNYNAKAGLSTESMKVYCRRSLNAASLLREGASNFDDFRSYLIRDVERFLFLSAANYNISHKLMNSGLSSWNQVTLYYASYYAARALLGMFGVYIDTPSVIVDVAVGNVGMQALRVRYGQRIVKQLSTYSGPHRTFWDFYYQAISPLSSYVTDTKLMIALQPVSSDLCWQIDKRNEVNYDSFEALCVIRDFDLTFKKSKFPDSLPGTLNTQFLIADAVITLAFKYAKKFKLSTDAFSFLSGKKLRKDKIKKFIILSKRSLPISIDKQKLFIS